MSATIMINDLEQTTSKARIDASLAEIHTLISTLEVQLKSGLAPTQLDIRPDEHSLPKTFAADRESSFFLMDY